MQNKLGDIARINHILEAILEIELYISNSTIEDFTINSMMRFACVKQMEIIGEASNHLSEELKSKFSEIEWAQIIGMRNVFVHEYFGIDTKILWEIIKNDLPNLKCKILVVSETIKK